MSKPETLPQPLGTYLKYEATPLTRVEVPADTGTKMGTFVDYPLRGKKLLALSDEQNGKVVVQPHNCIINVSAIAADALNAAGGLEQLKQDGDAYGIVYQGSAAA
ncbi:oxaloacetate decarboxylase alpha chain [Conchiformibius steedae]|uniref:oxaloacetate decarboxylase alpha chain n=1 Tax=Conchiformibius steedae TaxID=153493 RepID=UPI0026F05305|nr:oxaloacetate decarboxylase alpha chain [Conchiformibius steedae]